MSNESPDGRIETSGESSQDHSDASLVPHATDMIALGKPTGEPEKIEPSSKDIVLQRLSAGSSWDNLGDVPPRSDAADEPVAAPHASAKRSLPMAAVVAIAAVVGAVAGSAGTLGIAHVMAPKTDIAEQARTMESLIARLNADIASVKTAAAAQSQKVTKLSETVEKLRAPDATGSIAAPSAPAVAAQPNRLPVVEGWLLRDVVGSTAMVQGRDGLYEVLVGDPLPGVGRVDAIRRQDGRWVVVTARGLIVAR